MKKLTQLSIALLGVCAVAVATPAFGRELQAEEIQAPSKRTAVLNAKPSPGYRDRIVYVISDYEGTGSHIPTVYRVYHGTMTTVSSMNRASYVDLARSGQTDLASALVRFDPSIAVNGRR